MFIAGRKRSLIGGILLGFCIFAANWTVVRRFVGEKRTARKSQPPFTSSCMANFSMR
jgi:hypothetical protein